MRGGNITYGPVPVATGRACAPTAPGSFHVTWKDLHHRSNKFHNAPMPYSVFFNGGDAFHQDSVTVRSHGCVAVGTPDRTGVGMVSTAMAVGVSLVMSSAPAVDRFGLATSTAWCSSRYSRHK